MTMMRQHILPRKSRKPRPVPGSFAFPLLDALDLLYANHNTPRGGYERNEPAYRRARQRFWCELHQQIDDWGGAPPVIEAELRERCREVAQ